MYKATVTNKIRISQPFLITNLVLHWYNIVTSWGHGCIVGEFVLFCTHFISYLSISIYYKSEFGDKM